MVITAIPLTAKPVEAATVSQAQAIIAAGEMFAGLTREGMKAKMREYGTTPFWESWNGEWCQWFVSNCAVQAQISPSIVQQRLDNNRTFWKNQGRYIPYRYGQENRPEPGDIIYFNYEGKLGKNQWAKDRYIDKNGKITKNKWVYDFYLDEDGYKARNTWVKNKYVGSDGKVQNLLLPLMVLK